MQILMTTEELLDFLVKQGIEVSNFGYDTFVMDKEHFDTLMKPGIVYDLIYKGHGNMKISTIKEIRNLTGMGLVDAKTFSETLSPKILKTFQNKGDAERAKRLLESATAIVEIVERVE